MPDRRSHRGPAPRDGRLFDPRAIPELIRAVAHLSWLLGRGYAEQASLKLVGDRFALTARQRTAVLRCAATDETRVRRRRARLREEDLAGRRLLVDGYNVLTTVEAALAGAVVLRGRDGCYRDMASMHGSYRKVEETVPALELLGAAIRGLRVREAVIYLDRPVSNSGRLRGIMSEIMSRHGFRLEVQLVSDPDPLLARASDPVASADRRILDACPAFFDLAGAVVRSSVPGAWVVDLAPAVRNRRPS